MKKFISLFILVTALLTLNFAETKNDLKERTEEWFKNNPNSMPHWLTPEELERVGDIGKNFSATPPPTGPVRQTAEFERMQGVYIRYEFGIPMDLIQEMATVATVYTIVESVDLNSVISQYVTAGVDTSNCEFMIESTDSYWTRDYGPWYVVNGDNEVGICDFMYNRPRPLDDAIPSEAAPFLNEPYYGMSVVHTGGNYMTDGMGIAASTPIVYTESLDQQGITEAEVDQRMLDYLGIHTYHVVDDPNDTYIDHIDCWGKYLDVDKILIREVPGIHPQFDELEATAAYFASQISSYGNNYQVYRVNTPNDEPYGNSLILNDHVFVPIMNSSNDAPALAVYEVAMPGYTIVPILGGLQVWESTDALHCRTRGIVDKEMLHIYHVAKVTDQSPSEDYEISAEIVSYGGHTIDASNTLLYYKVNGGSWNSLPMILSKGTYTATIPQQSIGSVVSYYIHSEDNSGRIETHPFIGQADPHQFFIVNQPNITISVPDTIFASAVPDDSILKTFDIGNTGSSNLNYNADFAYTDSPSKASLIVESNDFESGLDGYTSSGTPTWSVVAGLTANCARALATSNQLYTSVLTSDTFDGTQCTTLTLDFDQNILKGSDRAATFIVEYYNGSSWEEIYNTNASSTVSQSIPLPVLATNMQIRFSATVSARISGDSWNIDNVIVSGSEVISLTWLTLNGGTTTNGIIIPSGSNTINVDCDAMGLSYGNYEAGIFINSDDPDEPTVILPVKFTVTDSTPLLPPINLSIITNSNSADLDWDDVDGATMYSILRSTDPYGSFVEIGTSAVSDYTDGEVLTGRHYFYIIIGTN